MPIKPLTTFKINFASAILHRLCKLLQPYSKRPVSIETLSAPACSIQPEMIRPTLCTFRSWSRSGHWFCVWGHALFYWWLQQRQNYLDGALQEFTELPSAAKSINTSGENPSKRLKLSLCREEPFAKLGSASNPELMQDLTNTNAGISWFPKPVTSPKCKKVAQRLILSNIGASTKWVVCTYNAWVINCSFVNASKAVPDDLLASHDQ